MSNLSRSNAIGAVAIALALFSGVANAQNANPIRIGSVLSLTGPASFLGEDARKAMELQIEAWNANGGLKGRPIEWIKYDDTGNAAQTRTFVSRLVEEKIDILIGGSTTGTTLAAVPVAEENKVPFISVASGLQIVDPVKPYVFKTVASDDMIARRVIEDVMKRGLKSIAVVTETSGYGQSGRTQTLAVAKELNMSVVADETFAPTDTNMTVQLTRLRNEGKAEAVVVVGAGQAPAILVKNYQELGLKLPLYLSPGSASKAFLDIVGAAGNGIRIPAAPLLSGKQLPADSPVKQTVLDFSDKYEKKWGKTPSAFAGAAYDALRIFADAYDRAGSTDREALRNAIEKTTKFPGTHGVFNITPQNHTGTDYKSLVLWEIQNGEWILVN